MNINKAHALAIELMTQHGLINNQVDPSGLTTTDWSFKFDSAVRRFGACYKHKNLITISRKLTELNDEAQVRDTILHEIAHALAPARAHHNRQWKSIAKAIGANPERCYDSSTVTTPTRKWKATCPSCKRTVLRHKRMKIACGKCCNKHNRGKFDEKYLFVYTPNVTTITQKIPVATMKLGNSDPIQVRNIELSFNI